MRRAIILPRQEAVEIHVAIQEVGTPQMELSPASDSRRGGLVAFVAAKSVTKLSPALVLQDNRQLWAVRASLRERRWVMKIPRRLLTTFRATP